MRTRTSTIGALCALMTLATMTPVSADEASTPCVVIYPDGLQQPDGHHVGVGMSPEIYCDGGYDELVGRTEACIDKELTLCKAVDAAFAVAMVANGLVDDLV